MRDRYYGRQLKQREYHNTMQRRLEKFGTVAGVVMCSVTVLLVVFIVWNHMS